jgi:hypothetical protein
MTNPSAGHLAAAREHVVQWLADKNDKRFYSSQPKFTLPEVWELLQSFAKHFPEPAERQGAREPEDFERVRELADRLVAPGSKAAHVSASECHEIRDFIMDITAQSAPLPGFAHKGGETAYFLCSHSGFCAGADAPALAAFPKKNILHGMLRLFQKWLLMRRLHKECMRYPPRQGNGWALIWNQTRVVKGAFIKDTAPHFPWNTFWGGGGKTPNEINSLLDSCMADGFISAVTREEDGKMFMRTSSKGDDFCGYSDFIEGLWAKYPRTWILLAGVVTSVFTFIVGSMAKDVWPFLLHLIEQRH